MIGEVSPDLTWHAFRYPPWLSATEEAFAVRRVEHRLSGPVLFPSCQRTSSLTILNVPHNNGRCQPFLRPRRPFPVHKNLETNTTPAVSLECGTIANHDINMTTIQKTFIVT